MNIDENIDNRIQAYLDGSLSEAERQAFEEELSLNDDLALRLKLHEETERSIGNVKALEFEKLLQQAGEKHAQQFNQKSLNGGFFSSRTFWYLLIMLAVMLTAIFSMWQFFAPKQVDAPGLYASYYSPYPAESTTRSGSSAHSGIITRAIEAYDNRRYQQCSDILETLLGDRRLSDNDKPIAYFYSALSYMAMDQNNRATERFTAVISHSQNLYIQQSHWYLALISLRNGDIERTRQQLNDVLQVTREGKYARLAENLLSSL